MNISRSILIEQDQNSINISNENAPYIIKELIDLMVEDFERDYKSYKKLCSLGKIPKFDATLLLCLTNLKDRIKDIVDEDDLEKVLGLKLK